MKKYVPKHDRIERGNEKCIALTTYCGTQETYGYDSAFQFQESKDSKHSKFFVVSIDCGWEESKIVRHDSNEIYQRVESDQIRQSAHLQFRWGIYSKWDLQRKHDDRKKLDRVKDVPVVSIHLLYLCSSVVVSVYGVA